MDRNPGVRQSKRSLSKSYKTLLIEVENIHTQIKRHFYAHVLDNKVSENGHLPKTIHLMNIIPFK